MANREKMVLEKLTPRFKSRKMNDEFEGSGHKKRRPDFNAQRQAKQKQWEDTDDE